VIGCSGNESQLFVLSPQRDVDMVKRLSFASQMLKDPDSTRWGWSQYSHGKNFLTIYLILIYQYQIYVMPSANRIPDDLQHLLPLTPAVFFILFALADGDKHGYAIMQSVSRISDNQFRMGPGTLYTTIQRLLDLDLIAETESAGGQSDHESRRRYYKLTRTGKTILTADISRMESVVRLAREKKLVPKTSE